MRKATSTISRLDDDHIYYNVLIPHDDNNNPNSAPTPASFSETRTEAILERADEYHLSIIRFSVPTQEIPIFIVTPLQTELPTPPNLDPTITPYTVTLRYLGVDHQENVIYTSFTNYPTPVYKVEEPHWDVNNPWFWVTSYQGWITDINTALATAFVTLGVIPGITEAPYFVFDPTTQLINLIVQKTYVGAVQIYMNNPCYNFFQDSFLTNFGGNNATNGKQNEFVVADVKNNSFDATHYIMRQEYPTLFNWNVFKRLVFLTGSIPVKSEYIRGPEGTNAFRQILTDFEPNSETGTDIRGSIQYFPPGEYRLVDLQGREALRRFDIQVFWEDNFQNLFPLMIPAHDAVSIKFLFRKKIKFIKKTNLDNY